MKNFTLSFKATIIALVLLGGMLFASGAQAQGTITAPPTVVKGTWLSANDAITVLTQQITAIDGQLINMFGHPGDLAKMHMTYYEVIRENIQLGEAVGTAVEKAHNKILGDVQLDANTSGFTQNEMQDMLNTAVDLLSI